MISNTDILRLDEVNEELHNLVLEQTKIELDGKYPDKIEVKTVTPHPHLKLRSRLILAFTYESILKHRTFSYDIIRKNSETMELVNEYKISNLNNLSYMDDHPAVNKYSHMHFFGDDWVSLSTHPKYQFIAFNEFMEIEYEYLDTNQILKSSFSYSFKLATIIYKSFEDNKIYFAVYEITPFIERQMIRNMHFEEYNEFVEIDYIMITPMIIYIFMYNSSNGKAVRGYMYYMAGPYIASKSMNNIVVDSNRFPLQLYEDKEMHWSFYKSLAEPVLYIDEREKVNRVSFKIKDYFDIFGNLLSISASEANETMNTIPLSDYDIIEPLHYRHTKKLMTDSYMSDYLDNTMYIENRVYFAINGKQRNIFTVFR
jgi:hypothetical protein